MRKCSSLSLKVAMKYTAITSDHTSFPQFPRFLELFDSALLVFPIFKPLKTPANFFSSMSIRSASRSVFQNHHHTPYCQQLKSEASQQQANLTPTPPTQCSCSTIPTFHVPSITPRVSTQQCLPQFPPRILTPGTQHSRSPIIIASESRA